MPRIVGTRAAAATQAASEDGVLDYVAALGTLASTIVAVVALVIAVRSSRDSQRSADAARRTAKSMEESLAIARKTSGYVVEQVAIQRTEHEAFLAEHTRQPDLTLELRLRPDAPDGRVDKARSTTTYLQLEVAVHNDGRKSAEGVTVNVIVPAWLDVRWSHADGSPIPDADPPAPDDYGIKDATGVQYDAKYLDHSLNVPAGYTDFNWVRFAIPPDTESVPFRVVVGHDSLDERLHQLFMVLAVFTD